MGALEMIKAGLMTSIQDMGRTGLAYYAIPLSGIMDRNAASIALLLLHKSLDKPIMECTSVAPTIKFHGSTKVAISGADFKWKLNDEPVLINSVINVQKDDILKGGYAEKQMRGYLAFGNDLKIDKVYGSYSTYSNARLGGYEGRLLRKGDVINWVDESRDNIGTEEIRIRKGPEFSWLSDDSKKLLTTTMYLISKDTNRMGMRLEGEFLDCSRYQLNASAPVLPGFIQLPPNGQPIVVLQDSQTTGGYPRIAYVQLRELSRLNQIPIGSKIRFKLDGE